MPAGKNSNIPTFPTSPTAPTSPTPLVRFFTSIYTLLLLYTIAALAFWGFSLDHQSRIIYNIERADLPHEIDSIAQPIIYQQRLDSLNKRFEDRTKQYIGE